MIIEFEAVLPDIQSAITLSGSGNGARIKLDVPESEFAEVVKLALMRGKSFKVTIKDE